MVFLATDLRPFRGGSHDALLRLGAEAGAAGLHLGPGMWLEAVPSLVAEATRVGLAVGSALIPRAERALPGGRRLPRLAAPDRDERDAALALASDGLMQAAGAGAAIVLLDLGLVSLTATVPAFARAFARREVADGELAAPLWAAACDERRARAPAVHDACLWALERVVRLTDRLGVRAVLPVAATPWEVPTPREAGDLVATFGAALGIAWDPGKLSALCALDLAISDDRLRALAAAAPVVLDNDAVGWLSGFLPGLGERDPRVAAHKPAATAPRIIIGPPDATDAEIALAVARAG